MARALVEHRQRQIGKRMVAYQDVARMLGTSAAWLRKYLSAYGEAKEPGWRVGLKIVENYNRLCERIEAENALRRLKLERLQGKWNATNSSDSRMGTPAATRKKDE